MSLKWRITWMTLVLMTACSVVLVLSINLDVARIFPGVVGDLVAVTGTVGIDGTGALITLDPDQGALVATPPPGTLQASGAFYVTESTALGVIDRAVVAVRLESVYKLVGIVLLAGVLAYLLASRATRPLSQLNRAIRQVEADRLTSDLVVPKSRGEVHDLALSFQQMTARLRNAFDSQKRFNASMAHELKTPLTVLRTNLDVLEAQDDATLDDYREAFRVLRRSTVRIDSLIESLLEMVQQENAPLDDDISLDALLSDVVEDARKLPAPAEVEIRADGPWPDVRIRGNELLLYRAISNVVENAVKYNRPGGRVAVSSRKDGDAVEVCVADTGPGIPPESLEAIFEPFHRLGSDRGGTGLGLSFSRSILALHGGSIRVESVVGTGTTFRIRLPIG